MSSVSWQIERALSEAINDQVLPQIQATLMSGQGQVPGRGWEEVQDRRSECRSEEALNRKFRSSSRDEIPRNFNRKGDLENTHYNSIAKKFKIEGDPSKKRVTVIVAFHFMKRLLET